MEFGSSQATIGPSELGTPPLLLRAADWLSDAAGFLRRPLVADELVETAQRHTGLDDFGQWQFLPSLHVLLQSCESEAALGAFGRFALRWDVLRFLENLLQLRAAEKASPAPAPTVERPIFVTGLPRSGTTFLHSLLMADQANVVPRCWQTIDPATVGNAAGEMRAIKRVDRQLKLFRWIAPDFGSMHPITATAPQECSEITAHVFASLRFDTTHRVPSYRAWLDSAGHLEAYRFHRYFLEHLARPAPAGQRWVLKCPDHVFALDAIQQVYPDARFVFVHRDPTRVLASVAHLTEVLRQPFTRHLDRAAIGRQVCDRWAEGAERIIAADETLPADRVVHVRYRDLTGDPAGTVEAIYAKLGLPFDEAFDRQIRAYVDEKPNGGYGGQRRRLDDYGIDPARERRRFSDYVETFDVAPERQQRVAEEAA
ncbi:MAG TPA: sulfotransferase [Stellaceae bacterium]|nr:sulfotransferase [Stellaceae bacterium]